MTHQEFIALVRQPHSVSVENTLDLKEMVAHYPYFSAPRILLSKVDQKSNSIHFSRNIKLATLYSANRRWLYYYIHPESALSLEPYRKIGVDKPLGGYFDMLQAVENEGGDKKESLKNLAERLKSARSMVFNAISKPLPETKISDEKAIVELPLKESLEYFSTITIEISENNAKKMIREKNYTQAISILKELNLSNPKKSVYFADQIRFLEKVIGNSKK